MENKVNLITLNTVSTSNLGYYYTNNNVQDIYV